MYYATVQDFLIKNDTCCGSNKKNIHMTMVRDRPVY